MPLSRKLIKIGHSKAVTLPSSWIENIERETGQKITELYIEVNGILKVSPVLEKKKGSEELSCAEISTSRA